MLEPLHIIDGRNSDAVTMVEDGVGSLRVQVLKVLRAARRDVSGVEIGGAVVDHVAEGVCRLELQAVGESPVQLGLQSMIGGRSPRHESRNRIYEPGVEISRIVKSAGPGPNVVVAIG